MKATQQEPRVRWHWQNLAAEELTERLHARQEEVLDHLIAFPDHELRWRVVQGLRRAGASVLKRSAPWWRHGRGWLYLPPVPWRKRDHVCLSASWHTNDWHAACSLQVGGGLADDDFTLHLCIPPVALWLSAENLLPRAWQPKGYHDYELGVRIHDGSVWFSLWSTMGEWSKNAPWTDPRSSRRQPTWHVVDQLLGKVNYSSREIGSVVTMLDLPEGGYTVKLTFERAAWKRPRLRRSRVVLRCTVESAEGIPIPGKGENSYDCEDDAVYSATFPARTVEEALSHMQQSILKRRQQYGGHDWQPASEAAA